MAAVESSTLLLAFGGMAGKLGIPPFEFLSITGGFPVKRLFVRDLHQAWYHRGIPEYGVTIEAIAAGLKRLLSEEGIERLVVTGTSAGGYAALLFGTLLRADKVLAFAPQTTISPSALGEMNDHRWDRYLANIDKNKALQNDWVDLREILPSRAEKTYNVYFDRNDVLDRLHAERIGEIDSVCLCPVSGGGHNATRHMRETGQLEDELRLALELSS